MAPIQVDNDGDATMPLIGPIPRLPAGTRLSYLAEGGANIVYRIFLPNISESVASGESESPATEDEEEEAGRRMCAGKLLRLRKMIESGTPYIETARSFRSQIRQLFRDDELLEQDLVRLPKNFISSCNEQLKADEASGARPKSRHSVYLSTKEPFGLLITDMTPAPGSGEVLWEFKPKWLVQSPSAPPNAARCRTCALREMKNYDGRKKERKAGDGPPKPQKQQQPQQQPFCPLDLVSDDFSHVLRATRFINNAPGTYRVANFLHRNPTLVKLRECQQRMNAVGLPGLHAECRDRAVSMTLRDCTMYVKVSIVCAESRLKKFFFSNKRKS